MLSADVLSMALAVPRVVALGPDPGDDVGCPVCGREACEDHLPPAVGQQFKRPASRAGLVGFSIDDLAQQTFSERRPLLMRCGDPVFRAGNLGQISAMRGFGKTWLTNTLGLVASTPHCEALGFYTPTPARVLIVDGEMPSQDIQDRFAILRKVLGLTGRKSELTIVAADWQTGYLPRVDTAEGQEALEPFIERADLIIIDNRSCLLNPEAEKEPSAWQPAQDWLLSLRRRGKAVLLDHHANRAGTARGHSKPEDVMDMLICLSRPDDYSQDQGARFIVTFDKSRGVHGQAVAPFVAHLTQDGWTTTGTESDAHTSVADKLLNYVRAAQGAGERPKSASAAISGARVNRNAGFDAWAQLLQQNVIGKHPDGGFGVL